MGTGDLRFGKTREIQACGAKDLLIKVPQSG
jgi:hypothetical protein